MIKKKIYCKINKKNKLNLFLKTYFNILKNILGQKTKDVVFKIKGTFQKSEQLKPYI